jgi:hypothetical protein
VLLDLDGNGLKANDLSNNTKSMLRVMERLDLDENLVLSNAEIQFVVEPRVEADLDKNGVSRFELAQWLLKWEQHLD